MYSLFNEPRNWKWMVPAALVAPVVWWWNDWVMGGDPWKKLAIIPLCLALVMGTSALINAVLYIYHRWAQMYADVQSVRNMSPEVRMFEAAKGMHPDAVKLLLVHRRSIWKIKYVPLKDVVDWIFDDLPTVHAGFVDFVLDHSSGRSVMSKGLLSQGSKQFDPEGIVTDYEQYDDLLHYLQAKLICTQAFGNQAPQWLPPWDPDLVRHRLGLDGAPYAVEEEGISEAMQSVIRAQAQWMGNGTNELKDLGATQATAVSSQPSAGNGNGKAAAKSASEPEVTAAQMDAIEKENLRYEQLLKGDSQ